MKYFIVFLGGGLGAAMRYGSYVYLPRLFGVGFPWYTLVVNVTGCFIMGALTAAMALRLNLSQEMRLFLTAGVLGGFTTFSSFSLDFALLFERRDFLSAATYVIGSVGLSLIAVFAGLAVVRAVLA